MAKKRNKPLRVLFSCFGKTDPARGERDGGLLHILRHYRPDAVMIFLTKEISEFNLADGRVEKTKQFIWEHWKTENGVPYQPEFLIWETEIEDPSDLDAMEAPLREALQELVNRYPKAEVLLNLSSGTPQMKMLLAQMTLELKNPHGIQVKSPEGRANQADPTNKKDYPVDIELELTEEAETDAEAPNRCSEPKLIPMRRAQQRERVNELLKRKDYQAVVEILASQSIVPEEALHMAEHLAARYDLQAEAARKALRGLKTDFPLYPKKPQATDEQKQEYTEVSEYFLMMKNFAETGRYSDFVLRLNPFAIRLQEALLNLLLFRQYKISLQALKGPGKKVKREQLLEENLRTNIPELLDKLNAYLCEHGRDSFRDSDPSIYIYNLILSFFPEAALTDGEKLCLTLLKSIGRLNLEGRNLVAHNLTTALTDDDIRNWAGCSCAELVQKLEKAIIALYPACTPSIFNIYRKCEDYIRERL